MNKYISIIFIVGLIINFSCKAPDEEGLIDFNVTLKDHDLRLIFQRQVRPLGKLLTTAEYPGKLEEPKIFQGQIYGIDRQSWNIVLFDEDFNISQTFGKVGEDAFDENYNFYNYGVIDSMYWVMEPNRYLFKIFDHQNNLIQLEKLGMFSNSAIQAGNNNYFFSHDDYDGGNIEFSSLNNDGQIDFKHSLKELINHSNSNEYGNFDLVYEGWLYGSDNYIVYICFKSDDFLVFDSSMKHLYNSKTVYSLPLPKIITEDNFGQKIFKTDPPYIFNSYSQVSSNKIFILNPVAKEEAHYIDVYDLDDTGAYSYSLKIPFLEDGQVPLSFVVKDNSIVIFYENMTIKEFSFKAG